MCHPVPPLHPCRRDEGAERKEIDNSAKIMQGTVRPSPFGPRLTAPQSAQRPLCPGAGAGGGGGLPAGCRWQNFYSMSSMSSTSWPLTQLQFHLLSGEQMGFA
ncbi:Nut Family Member 2D [Manis pentadactyla]|nr:Nut Family Member 2D [Manis pentadactyla]